MVREKKFVLLGDIVSSRKIDDETSFQKQLESACRTVNTKYQDAIYADFKIIKGIDEIGGVLSSFKDFYGIIGTLLGELYPNRMRMALVHGFIDVGLDTGDVSRMDGPPFHRADAMIEELKKSKLMFRMSLGNELVDTLIEGEVNLILLLRSRWSGKMYRVVEEYEECLNQYKVAETLGVSQQAVSKYIKRSYWKEIRSVENKLIQAIELYSRDF